MPCPTCDHTLLGIGHGAFHCMRCGTVVIPPRSSSEDEPAVYVPKLVERCQEFEADHYMHPTTYLGDKWRQLGIAESIHRPEDRPQGGR